MTAKRQYIDYLNDTLDAICKVEMFTQDMDFEHFKADEKTTFAVIRAFPLVQVFHESK